jgi:serine/threonine-protein kinase
VATSFLELLQKALDPKYSVHRELGRGATSRVFLATEHELGRTVVLKVLRPELAADVDADRFRREIRLLANLHHPHVVPVLAAGQSGFFLYYTMPHIDGETLRQRLERESPAQVEEALRIGYEVASALDYAHRHNVLHRDIKPENVLIHDGHAVVADFGVARALNSATGERITRTGITLGTPAYMSPEQASGDCELDPRSDIYSLGCVLFEMLTARPPFTAPTTQAMIARRFTEPAPLVRQFRGEVPEVAERVVAKALAREPSARFQTAADLAKALDAARVALKSGQTTVPNELLADPSTTQSSFDWRRLRFW